MFSLQNTVQNGGLQFCQNSNLQPFGISMNQTCPSFSNQYQAFSYPQIIISPFSICKKAKSNPILINHKVNFTKKHSKIPRKKFSAEEDEKLKNLVEQMGSKKWEQIAKEMPGRTGRQCRDRYQNYLIPGYFNGQWSKTEDELLLRLYMQFGSQWSKMAQYFSNRSSNSLKNRWNYFVSRHMTDPLNFYVAKSNAPQKVIVNADANADAVKNDEGNDQNVDVDDENDDVIYESIIDYSNSMDFMYFEPANENEEVNCKDEFPYISNEIVIE